MADSIHRVVWATYQRRRGGGEAVDRDRLAELAARHCASVNQALTAHALGLPDPPRQQLLELTANPQLDYEEKIFDRTFGTQEFGSYEHLPQMWLQRAIEDLIHGVRRAQSPDEPDCFYGLLDAIRGVAPAAFVQAHILAPLLDPPIELDAAFELYLSGHDCYVLTDRVIYGPR